tara:strand:- start:9153 stop:9830 length:678 start_codon:yes stop_codon:yes gene_type:complete
MKITPIILAGGQGSRLRKLIGHHQKTMILIEKRPFLCKILDQIISLGFKEVIICTGYKSNQVKSFFQANYKGLNIKYSEEKKPLGTGGAIKNASLNYKIVNMLIFNGDSYCKINNEKFLNFLSNDVPFITLVKSKEKKRFGSVFIDNKNKITDFKEKKEGTKTKWINAGIYFFSTKYITSFFNSDILSLEYDIIPNMIKKGLYAWPYGEDLIDIGTERSLNNLIT